MVNIRTWRDYENYIYNEIRFKLPSATATKSAKVPGKTSNILREIDIYITEQFSTEKIILAVDCKFYNKKVDIKTVESAIGMAEDIDCDRFIIVANKGYTDAAYERVSSLRSKIELEILSPTQLERFQAPFGLPYAGTAGALLLAPFGWVVDGARRGLGPAVMYPLGDSFESALEKTNFMYAGFWSKKENNDSIDDLNSIMMERAKLFYGNDIVTTFISHFQNENYPSLISRSPARADLVEIRGILDFGDYLFFCVANSPRRLEKSAIRNIKHVCWHTKPMRLEFERYALGRALSPNER